MSSPAHVVVAGAGAASLGVVETLRRENYDGRITVLGEEPNAPYDRPPLSKKFLTGDWDAERIALRPKDKLDALGVDWQLGRRAVGLDTTDRRVVLDDASFVGYDELVIATGARARQLPGTDGLAGAHLLRTIEDASGLRDELSEGSQLLVVGGGFLGAETAATARQLGCAVTLVTDLATPLSDVLGAQVGEALTAVHRERGVRIEQGTVAELTSQHGRVTGARLHDGREIAADVVLVSIGAIPNTAWLEGSGIRLDNGVVCDEAGRAGPGVWAAGDVASWWNPQLGRQVRIEHRTNATEQGMAVARGLLGGAPPAASVPYVWSDQYDLKVQIFGMPGGADQFALVDGDIAERKFAALCGRNGYVCAAVGVNMVRPLRALRKHVATGTAWEDALSEVTA